jgi:pantoate--beta-alanine ligase
MKTVNTKEEVRKIVAAWRREGLTVSLVPTMGYLHEGHQSLIKRAAGENDRVVVSVFVNPIQFAPNEDLQSYPRDLAADQIKAEEAGASLIFAPAPEEMYAPDFSTYIQTGDITKLLCGKTRPTHFQGVCSVVCKLFNIVAPDRAYFGQKDAQQLAVVRRMVRDLDMNLEIIGCPIIREEDGLAKSSRNTYLNSEERQAALVLSRALKAGREMMEKGESDGDKVLDKIRSIIATEQLARLDYAEMVSWDGIEIHHTIDRPVLVAIAVYIGKTRLIDNFIWEV